MLFHAPLPALFQFGVQIGMRADFVRGFHKIVEVFAQRAVGFGMQSLFVRLSGEFKLFLRAFPFRICAYIPVRLFALVASINSPSIMSMFKL